MDAIRPIVAFMAIDGAEEGAIGGMINPEEAAGPDEP